VPRRDTRLRVEDMLAAVERIERYVSGLSFERFCDDEKTVDAVIRNFEVLGEAARHVEDPIASRCPGIPWADIRDMRNILIHGYFGVDMGTVWTTVVNDLPALRRELASLLAELPPE
jgi:uncharacterized protein with HEPN domain